MTGRIPARAAKLVAALLATTAVLAVIAGAASAAGTVIYNNIASPLPGNLPSVGFEATSASEFGGQVELAGASATKTTVTVGMSSWACESGGAEDGSCVGRRFGQAWSEGPVPAGPSSFWRGPRRWDHTPAPKRVGRTARWSSRRAPEAGSPSTQARATGNRPARTPSRRPQGPRQRKGPREDRLSGPFRWPYFPQCGESSPGRPRAGPARHLPSPGGLQSRPLMSP
jgi:hypothetical protein